MTHTSKKPTQRRPYAKKTQQHKDKTKYDRKNKGWKWESERIRKRGR